LQQLNQQMANMNLNQNAPKQLNAYPPAPNAATANQPQYGISNNSNINNNVPPQNNNLMMPPITPSPGALVNHNNNNNNQFPPAPNGNGMPNGSNVAPPMMAQKPPISQFPPQQTNLRPPSQIAGESQNGFNPGQQLPPSQSQQPIQNSMSPHQFQQTSNIASNQNPLMPPMPNQASMTSSPMNNMPPISSIPPPLVNSGMPPMPQSNMAPINSPGYHNNMNSLPPTFSNNQGMPPAMVNSPMAGFPSQQQQQQQQQQQMPGSFPPMPGMQAQSPVSGYSANRNFNQQPGAFPSPMQNAAAPQKRLDPDQMPNPIQVMSENQKTCGGVFSTLQIGQVPPLVSTKFTVQDQGNSSPRYLRSTMYNIPTNTDIMKQCAIPFALVISPFARIMDQEMSPPIVDFGEIGPIRCVRCKAYMSPHMQFIDAGRRFQCLLCKATTEGE
jgi:protein transport protein SEC24